MTMQSEQVADPYYSRIDQWEVADRADPVIWGDHPGPLSPTELTDYEERGYKFFPQVVSEEEAEELLAEADRVRAEADVYSPGVIAEPGSEIVRSVFRLHRTHERFKAIAKDPRIVDVVRQLLGGEVYIHQCRINYKPAFHGKEFFWHSDFETWHVEDGMPRMRAVSVSLNLTENTEFNGPLMVVDGSHKKYVRCAGATPENHFEDSLRKQEYGVPSRESLEILVQNGGIHAPKGLPGSATMFECNTMHGSVRNLSPYPRVNLFMVYNSVENPLVEPFGGLPPRPDFLGEREIIPISEL